MKLKTLVKVAGVSALIFSTTSAWSSETITGAGSTFIYPVLAKWANAYHQKTGVAINYQSIGSGGGIKLITNQTVVFGATDAPLSSKELQLTNLVQFPMVMGGIVPVVNIPSVASGHLKLDGEVLADIYLGKIKSWNDAAIKALNPTLKLPTLPIYTVHRAEGSGTTFNFTAYLSRVSSTWQQQVGVNKEVSWPKAANQLGGKGNAGVANLVKRIPGAIGYVEFAYAAQNNLSVTQMRNQAGKFVTPSLTTFQNAAGNADWQNSPAMDLILINQPGKQSWPIAATTFILMPKQSKNTKDAAAAEQALKFFDWSYNHGAQMAKDLDYVPMPKNVVALINQQWAKQFKTPPNLQVAKAQ